MYISFSVSWKLLSQRRCTSSSSTEQGVEVATEAEEAGAAEVNEDDHPLPFWIFLFVLNLYDRVNAKRLGHRWQHVLVVMAINM